MITVTVRFYEELNDFLPSRLRKTSLVRDLPQPSSVKDLIESYGVPHTEVDLIMVNSTSVTFDYLVKHGDRISVYPVFESIDISGITRLQPRPLRRLRFVADANLGKLARTLRLLGFDVTYDTHADNSYLVEQMRRGKRAILTTNRRLLMRSSVTRGYCVHARTPNEQLLEVIRRFDLVADMHPLTRCVFCNTLVVPVEKKEIENHLPQKTRERCHNFTRCPTCGRIFWKGSHLSDLDHTIAWIRRRAASRV